MKARLLILLTVLLQLSCKKNDPPFAFADFSQLGASVPDGKLKKLKISPSAVFPERPEDTTRFEVWNLIADIPVIYKSATLRQNMESLFTGDTIVIKGYKFSIQEAIQTGNIMPLISEVLSFDQSGTQTLIFKVIDVSGRSYNTCYLLFFTMNSDGSVTCLNKVSGVTGRSWLVSDGLFNYDKAKNSLQVILLNENERTFQLCEVGNDRLTPGAKIARFSQKENGCLQVSGLSTGWAVKSCPEKISNPCGFNFEGINAFSYAEMIRQN